MPLAVYEDAASGVGEGVLGASDGMAGPELEEFAGVSWGAGSWGVPETHGPHEGMHASEKTTNAAPPHLRTVTMLAAEHPPRHSVDGELLAAGVAQRRKVAQHGHVR